MISINDIKILHKPYHLLFLAILCFLFSSAACHAQPVFNGQLFRANFEGEDVLKTWGATNDIYTNIDAGFNGTQSIRISVPKDKISSNVLRITLPYKDMQGVHFVCSAMIKAEGVQPPQRPSNGIKLLLHLVGPNGDQWFQPKSLFGSFGWKLVKFKAYSPRNITKAELFIGLDAVTGAVNYDDITLSAIKSTNLLSESQVPNLFRPAIKSTRFRGAVVRPDISKDSLQLLGGDWNSNLVRWQLIRNGADASIIDFKEYDIWLERELRRIDLILPYLEMSGLRMVIDLHSPPGGLPTVGGYSGSDGRLFTDRETQKKFINIWQQIALRFKNSKVVWGYDLANEPVDIEVTDDCDDWQALALRAARAIRDIDQHHVIIVEPSPLGLPYAIESMVPLSVPGVVYSIHMYIPDEFTHQGFLGRPDGINYPGLINNTNWGKDRLRSILQPVHEWQQRYNLPIYVGEFGAIRWSPNESAYRYLKDCIDLFEEYGWDWTFFTFRAWHGWSAEHSSVRLDETPSILPTNRELLLRRWYQKNSPH